MAVSPSRAAEVLAKCARHCCICRLAAVRGNTPINVVRYTPINVVRYDGGTAVLAGGQTFGETYDLRLSARYRNAVNQLYSHHLVEGDAELLYVSHQGYLLADDVLAAGSVGQDAEPGAAADGGA